MTVHAVVTEAKHGTALLAECRRCLSLGVDMKAPFIKQVIELIEDTAITDLTAWVQATDDKRDGRNTAEATAVA